MEKHPQTMRSIIAGLAVSAVASGLLLTGAPAAQAATNKSVVTMPRLSEAATNTTSARFWAKVATVVGVTAEAKAVAVAGVDVTGKMLLEEEKTRSPHAVLRNLVAPTKAEAERYGIVVNSMGEGQRKLAEAVKVYDAKVLKAKKRIAKLKLRIEQADSAQERRELKRKLRQARAWLRELQTSWKHIPIIAMAEGTCYLNSGRDNRLDLKPFSDCVDGNKETVYAGWVPQLREAVIVSITFDDGRYIVSCINFMGFDIPEGTPDRSLYLVVESLLAVKAKVTVAYTETVDLTVGGELTCPDGRVVTDEKTKRVTKTEMVTREVSATSVQEALRFGEEEVKYDDRLREEVRVKIMDTMTQEVGEELTLTCPNQKPEGEIIQWPAHLEPREYYRIKVVGSDPEDGGAVELLYSVSGGARLVKPGDPDYTDHPTICDIEGTNKVCTFWIRANESVGVKYVLELQVKDGDGNTSRVYDEEGFVEHMPV